MKFVDLVYKKCQHPHEVINPYTREKVLVPCGVCAACRYSKSVTSTLRLHAQTECSKYCYFVSLTYSNRFVPYLTYEKTVFDDTRSVCHFSSVVRPKMYHKVNLHSGKFKRAYEKEIHGLARKNEVFDFTITASTTYLDDFLNKADLSANGKYPNLKGRIPYLCHADLSLFLKRFRKHVTLRGIKLDEPLHTYIVGEYGPKTFRPHFHILFFFDSDRLAQSFGQITHGCWRFGTVDYSMSRGKAQSYCSEYLNSFTSLPLHLQENRRIRPFSRFSNNFGNRFFASAISEAKDGKFDKFINGKDICIDGENVKVFPWRSLLDTCFYRPGLCPHITASALYEILWHVRSYVDTKEYRILSLLEISRQTFKFLDECSHTVRGVSKIGNTPHLPQILRFLGVEIRPFYTAAEQRSIIGRFYLLLLQTKRFLSGLGYTFFTPSTVIDTNKLLTSLHNSINFYHERQKQGLLHSLEMCASFESDFADIFLSPTEKRSAEFWKSEFGQIAKHKLSCIVQNKVKHRELNDLNNIFTSRNFYYYGRTDV